MLWREKILVVVVFLSLVIFSGCYSEMTLVVKDDGSGYGTIVTDEYSGQSQQENAKEQGGVEILSSKKLENGDTQIEVRWKDFNAVKLFKGRSLQDGDKVRLEFPMAYGRSKVHVQVPGDIISTTGQIDPNNKRLIHFIEGESVVVYKRDRTGIMLFIFGMLTITLLIVKANWPNIKEFLRKKLE